MSVILAGILIIGGLIGAAAFAIGIPVLFGMMAYDASKSRKAVPATAHDARMRIAVERGVARSFVIAGSAFWSVAIFAAMHSFRETGVGYALLAAFFPLLACLVTLVVGWYYERLTAALLVLASAGVVVWGVIYQFELGVWMIMTFALIGPMVTAAVLFWMARREQEAFELALSRQPELAPIPVENV